jgi:hypothetical protein
MDVAVQDEDDPAPRPGGASVILLSGTVREHRIENRYRHLALPIVTWNPSLLSDLSMTGPVKDADFGSDLHGPQLFLFIVNAPHPLAAGLPNGMALLYHDSMFNVSWGRPGLGATIIATLPGQPEKAVDFAYEKGALMDGTVSAPARRVMLFPSSSNFGQLLPDGVRLFDAAVRWAGRTSR